MSDGVGCPTDLFATAKLQLAIFIINEKSVKLLMLILLHVLYLLLGISQT